jgi:uridine kinase
MTKREQLLQVIAAKIVGLPATSIARVAVDGVDGAGKTTFANELAACLTPSDRQIIRASVNAFHNPRGQIPSGRSLARRFLFGFLQL